MSRCLISCTDGTACGLESSLDILSSTGLRIVKGCGKSSKTFEAQRTTLRVAELILSRALNVLECYKKVWIDPELLDERSVEIEVFGAG